MAQVAQCEKGIHKSCYFHTRNLLLLIMPLLCGFITTVLSQKMFKSNQTIGWWLNDVVGDADDNRSTCSEWSDDSSRSRVIDRVTTVGGWRRPYNSPITNRSGSATSVGRSSQHLVCSNVGFADLYRIAQFTSAPVFLRPTVSYLDVHSEIILNFYGVLHVRFDESCRVEHNYGVILCENGASLAVDSNYGYIYYVGVAPFVGYNGRYVFACESGTAVGWQSNAPTISDGGGIYVRRRN